MTPKSKVYANDFEWHEICQAGFECGMFGPIAEDQIFVNNLGDKVLQGAMGGLPVRDKIAATNKIVLWCRLSFIGVSIMYSNMLK